jgi:alginate O-acetyltransferase complex protein AlgI
MPFSSTEYVYLFLPASLIVYYWLTRVRKIQCAKSWLALSSLFFYAWWNPQYLPLILISLVVNYWIGKRIAPTVVMVAKGERNSKAWLIAGICFNLVILIYYKYSGFVAANLAKLASTTVEPINPLLPLAISFFTFTQVAYLIDSYRGEVKEYGFLNYTLFVTFFPHLVAGPIVHHKEIVPQFATSSNLTLRYRNLALGLTLFSIGLAKKLLFADTLALWATAGFDKAETLNFAEAWLTSLCYTFQLYFDFSGYTDMALGAALMFNIRMPINFNSPYRASNLIDFWRRWHISLSRFLRDYLYVPLGGNRRGKARTYINLLATFILGGLWHGASWMFIAWGALHGLGVAANRLWRDAGYSMPYWLGWLITFNFVNITWVFFRAKDLDTAMKVLKGMIDLSSLPTLTHWGGLNNVVGRLHAEAVHPLIDPAYLPLVLVAAFGIALIPHNSTGTWMAAGAWRRLNLWRAFAYGMLGALALTTLLASTYSEFIYFNF